MKADDFNRAASMGDSSAMNSLGDCYYYGYGIARNRSMAQKWYKNAAQTGFTRAQVNLALMCYYGTNDSKTTNGVCAIALKRTILDPNTGGGKPPILVGVHTQRLQALLESAKRSAPPVFSVPKGYTRTEPAYLPRSAKGLTARRKQCSSIGRVAALSLRHAYIPSAEMYGKSSATLEQTARKNAETLRQNELSSGRDFNAAFQWFSRAAEQGDKIAQVNTGVCYKNGNGTEKDLNRAFQWFKKSAELGNVAAMLLLGDFYSRGDGVIKNDTTAVYWYRMAAGRKNAYAQFNLGNAYAKGLGLPKDEGRALSYYSISANTGFHKAQFALGRCYENGLGVVANDVTAADWYEKAAESGNADAMCRMGVLCREGRGVNRDAAAAVLWLEKAATAGSVDAMVLLGEQYLQAGDTKLRSKALEWLDRAAALGNAVAAERLKQVS